MKLLTRRHFLRSGLVLISGLTAGSLAWPRLARIVDGSDEKAFGLMPPDYNGLMLLSGFSSRIVAAAHLPVAGTMHTWHRFPDGGAVFASPEGGWIYVSNSESGDGEGGVSALRFNEVAEITDAYRILSGTTLNCSGGSTPWGTWLSCEEYPFGLVWECDPTGENPARSLPALGTFQHEAVAVNPAEGMIYQTEDLMDGGFYRFIPENYPDLSNGRLEVAHVEDAEILNKGQETKVRWVEVPDPSARKQPTRFQVTRVTRFRGGEGTWFQGDKIYFTTKGDDRIWIYDCRVATLRVFYDAKWFKSPQLTGGDNITGMGDHLFVAEDGGNMELVAVDKEGKARAVVRFVGEEHIDSEVTGVAFNPVGDRIYVSSQRAFGAGATYEIKGPWAEI